MNPLDLVRERGGLHVLDVREPDEWAAGHIEGSRHIPLGELAARVAEVPVDRKVVTVCRMGARSDLARKALNAMGVAAENLDGGLQAWAKAGLPLRTPEGAPGRVI